MIGKHLFDLEIQSAEPIYVPAHGGGGVYVGGVLGGHFAGERLSGQVLPAGGDWARIAPCGAARLDVRLVLRAEGGGLFEMRYAGRMHGPGETLQRLGRGEHVAPEQYYMRIAPVFEVHAPELTWLDRIVALGTGEVCGAGRIRYRILEVV